MLLGAAGVAVSFRRVFRVDIQPLKDLGRGALTGSGLGRVMDGIRQLHDNIMFGMDGTYTLAEEWGQSIRQSGE